MNPLSSLTSRGVSLRRLLPGALIGLFCLLTAHLAAQGAHQGTVSGVISNQATNDLLSGAVVSVEGSTIAATAERGGAYSLSLPEGNHTLVVSFSGLDTQRIPVTVTASQNTIKNVEMTS